MRCLKCDRDIYLIRGVCENCDPVLHAERSDLIQRYREADRLFKNETGKSAIQVVDEFDDFCATRGLS